MTKLDADIVDYDVTVSDGKYRFVYFNDGTRPRAYRHGERWLAKEDSMVGDKATYALVARIAELEGELQND